MDRRMDDTTTGDQKFSSVELKRFMLSTNIFVLKFCLTKCSFHWNGPPCFYQIEI